MALLTDDMDIQTSYLRVVLGGNGDYYPQIINEVNGLKEVYSIRVATSGGLAPVEVKVAIAELFRALEKHNLNEYPI
jgi:hypothetical protein